MKTFVFQGDSITDAGRNRENDDYRGNGYPTFVAGMLGLQRPGELRFLNRLLSYLIRPAGTLLQTVQDHYHLSLRT